MIFSHPCFWIILFWPCASLAQIAFYPHPPQKRQVSHPPTHLRLCSYLIRGNLLGLLVNHISVGLLVHHTKGSLLVNQRWSPCSPCRPPPPLLLTLRSCCSVSAVTRLGRLTPAPAGNQITADPNKWLVGPGECKMRALPFNIHPLAISSDHTLHRRILWHFCQTQY